MEPRSGKRPMSAVASEHVVTDGALMRPHAWRLQWPHEEVAPHRTHVPWSLRRSPIGLAIFCLHGQSAHPLVLISSHEGATLDILEQVCIHCSATAVAVKTVHEAEGITVRRGLAAFGFVVLDTGAFGKSEGDQQRMTCRLLRAWTEAYPGLPFVLIGTERQKACHPQNAG